MNQPPKISEEFPQLPPYSPHPSIPPPICSCAYERTLCKIRVLLIGIIVTIALLFW